MYPTTGYLQILPFLTEFMVDLITISHHSPGEVLKELPWMARFSGWLPIVKNDRIFGTVRIVPINPHICLLAIFDFRFIDTHAFHGRFICVNDFAKGSEGTMPADGVIGIMSGTTESIMVSFNRCFQ